MKTVATVSSKGQVTIPKAIRDLMALEKTDKLLFTATSKDLLLVKPLKRDFLTFGGSVKPKKKPEDFKQIRQKAIKKMARG